MGKDIEQRHFKEILINLGPTIKGVKPAELLNLKQDETGHLIKSSIENYQPMGILPIKKFKKNGRLQVLFYHKEKLSATLTDKVNYEFLLRQGFPHIFSLNQYLNILKSRLNSPRFPHEIGIFLGYPLKDVLGYMGYPFQLVEVKGWRYYGSRKISHNLYQEFQQVRQEFDKFINDLDKPEDFYNFLDPNKC